MRKTIATVVVVAAAFAALGYWFGRHGEHAAPATHAVAAEAKKPLYWYDPMYPQQRFDQPGKSPFWRITFFGTNRASSFRCSPGFLGLTGCNWLKMWSRSPWCGRCKRGLTTAFLKIPRPG